MVNPAFVLAVAFPLLATATPLLARANNDSAVFNIPVLTHFLHMNALTSFPVNVSDIDGIRGRYPNIGGNLTGGITGTIVNIGAATEWFPVLLNGTASYYTNTWTINATVPSSAPKSVYKRKLTKERHLAGGTDIPTPPAQEYTTIYLSATAHLTYANEFLHGFGPVTFSSGHPAFLDLNVRSFYAEIEAGYRTGAASVDVFEVETGGKVDGRPIVALLPPGAEG